MKIILTCAVLLLCGACLAFADGSGGNWNMAVDTGEEVREFPIVIEADGEKVVATIGESKVTGTIREGVLKLEGEVYSAPEGYSAMMKLSAKVDGNKMSGDITWDMYDVTFTATKTE